MSEGGIDWHNYKVAQKLRRRSRLPRRTGQIMALKKQGYSVKQITEYHFRIRGRLDVFPIHNRWHDIKTNKRGGYREVMQFVREFFKEVKNVSSLPVQEGGKVAGLPDMVADVL